MAHESNLRWLFVVIFTKLTSGFIGAGPNVCLFFVKLENDIKR